MALLTSLLTLTSVPGGPVLLDGNDPADHGGAVDTYIADVYANLEANIAPGYVHNGQVAVVGTCASVLTTADPTLTIVEFDTALEVDALFSAIGLNTYQIVHICSDDDSTLPQPVEDELDKWGTAIAAHVNRGGGLFATGHSYNWLGDLFPALTVLTTGFNQSYVTADGNAFFATLNEDDPLAAISHYSFTDVNTTPLLPLLSAATGGGGNSVAFGGTTVRFPQISFTGPTGAMVGDDAIFTLVAADADGTLLSANSFDWTITGATAAAGSGTDITDANGEFEFTFSGTAKGDTRITVQLTPGGGSAAGAALTTTWMLSPDAPTITSAVDVAGEDGSVLVSWNPPADDGGGALSDYVLQWSLDGTTWTTVADDVSTSTSFTVPGLDDAVEHQFRVAAGQGPWSTPAPGTPIGSPPAPDLHSFTAAEGSSSVDWDAPSTDNGSAITHYVVQYSPAGAWTWTTLSPDPTTSDALITGLTENERYDVRVAAVSDHGQGAWSDPLSVAALSVPDPVENLEFIAEPGTVVVVWSEPEFDGGTPITGYEVTASNGASCTPEHWHPAGEHTAHWWRCTYDNVDDATEFTATVLVVNVRGSGDGADASGTPLPACPAPDPDIEVRVGPFADVSRVWHRDPVEWARTHGITVGLADGVFGPEQPTTRLQLATMLWRTFDEPVADAPHEFVDTPAHAAVAWAFEEGFVEGVGSDRFAPDELATRAEWMTVLWRATCSPVIDGDLPFTDVVAGWKVEPIHWGASTGVTIGRNPTIFDPDWAVTRGEAVTMLWRWVNR